jgi:hypothetical protein
MEKFVKGNGVEIKQESEINHIDPGRNLAVDSQGNSYQYRKLVWAANQKTLYKIIDLGSLLNKKTVTNIIKRRELVLGKIGGDSVFTLYITINFDKNFFSEISSSHFFYTPSTSGLSNIGLEKLNIDRKYPTVFVEDKELIRLWLKQYLNLTTYEISCPVLRDDSLAPAGKTGLIVSTLFDYSLTKHIQAMGWYNDFRELMTNHMIDVLEEHIYPGIRAATINSFTSSPLTIEKISGTSDGAITGWAFTNDIIPAVNKLPKVASSVLTPIPNIFQAGQWTYSPSGLPISILTGKLASDRILKELV